MKLRILFSLIIFCALVPLGIKAQNTHWQGLTPWSSTYFVNDFYEDTTTNLLYATGVVQAGICSYDGSSFTSIGSRNFQSLAKRIIKYNDTLYISVSGAGEGIMKWNGSDWDTTGIRTDGMVWAFYVYNGELYVGGVFSTIGGIAADCLAKYDGTSWSTVGNFHGGGIDAITSYNGELYIGGTIVDSSGHEVCIQRWDGSHWHNVGAGFHGALASVDAMEVYNNILYMGGSFSLAGGDFANYIAKWDGTTLSDVGGGVAGINNGNGQIHDLMVYNNSLYVAGAFSYAGGLWSQSIAKWDGTNWCSFGDTLNNRIVALGKYNGELYIGSSWWIDNPDTLGGIAKWIGGNYIDTCGVISTNIGENNSSFTINIFPNPASNHLTIQSKNISDDVSIQLCDVLGQIVMDRKEEINSGELNVEIDSSELKNGIYFVRLEAKGRISMQKIIIQQ